MIPDHHVLIKSPVVQSVPVRDNGEAMVDLAAHAEARGSTVRATPGVRVREGVADKLVNAQQFVPSGFHLFVVEGYRSPADQEILWHEQRDKLKAEHPDWTDAQLDEETSILYAPPGAVMPHASGGAVDITLVDEAGTRLDMGTEVNVTAASTEKRTYTLAQNITPEQKLNRQLLITAMNAGLFTNYATEWWHWSTGDQYWAYSSRQPFAVYGTV